MNKKIIIALTAIIVIAIIAIVGLAILKVKTTNKQNDTTISNNSSKEETKNNEEENNMYSTGKHHAEIEIKNYGKIELELDADIAPITVANFAKLVNEGFYDGLTFHRIIDGFMIQGRRSFRNRHGRKQSEDKRRIFSKRSK